MENSKKTLIVVAIIIMIVAGCVAAYFAFNTNKSESKNGAPTTSTASSSSSEDEQTVKNTVEEYIKQQYGKVVEEVKFDSVKVYTKEEIASDEMLKDYKLSDKDIVFEINYELKIAEGTDDMMQFTAATGEIDGQWVKNKYNCGVAKYNGENDYTIENFGTAF